MTSREAAEARDFGSRRDSNRAVYTIDALDAIHCPSQSIAVDRLPTEISNDLEPKSRRKLKVARVA